MTIFDALTHIMNNGNPYARSYAQVALREWGIQDEEWRRTQVLYVLSNTRARTLAAKEAKSTLQAYLSK